MKFRLEWVVRLPWRTLNPKVSIGNSFALLLALAASSAYGAFVTSADPGGQPGQRSSCLVEALARVLASRESAPAPPPVSAPRTSVEPENRPPSVPAALALENGDAKLLTIRMNWSRDGNYNNWNISQNQFRDLTLAMKKLPGMQLLVVVDGAGKIDAENAVTRLPKDIRARISLIHQDDPVYLWAQDGSKPAESGTNTVLPRDLTRGYNYYSNAIRRVAETGHLTLTHSQVRFEGGNMVIGARHVFVGPDIVTAAANDFHLSRQKAINKLSEEFGKPVVELGYQGGPYEIPRQIDFHIDLTMAAIRDRVTGKEKILLESPRLAVELLLGGADPKSLPGDARPFYDQLIRGQIPPSVRSRGIRTPGEKALQQLFSSMDADKFVQRQNELEQLETKLKSLGYEVVLVPGLSQDASRATTSTHFFNYTNSIFSDGHAIIPEMGVRVWDTYFQNQLRSLGYDFTTTSVPQESLCLQGGIRCLSETYRYPKPPSLPIVH